MHNETPSSQSQPLLIGLLLILIIIIGAGLRLYNPLWDVGTFPHPDERSTLLFYAAPMRWPDEGIDPLDPRQSSLNPFWDVGNQQRRSYTYGHFPLYGLVLVGNLLVKLAPTAAQVTDSTIIIDFFQQATTGTGYAVVGRMLVALLDTVSIYFVFLIARKLYGPWAGLLAAVLSAFAVLHIQLAHFFAVDPISTTFVLWAIYGSLQILEQRTARSAIITGIAIGLAISSKYSAFPIVLAPAMAGWYILNGRETDSNNGFGTAVRLVGLTAITSFVVFALTSPFVLLDWENFYQAVVEEQGNMVSGEADFPFTRQYRNTTAYVYFIEQQIKWGLGYPLGILAFAGFGWALVRAITGTVRPREAIILAWLIPYFGLNGLFLAKFIRYMSPVTPFVIILGVGLLIGLARRTWPGARVLAVVIAVLIVTGTGLWAFMFVNGVYATEHSWITTSRWVYDNVPDGACIAREHWEEGVPRDWAWKEPGMSPWAHGYNQPQLPMYDPDTPQKYELIRDILRTCDYLIIASNRMLRTLPNLEERYPLSTAYYQALFAGRLGYDLVHEQATPPRLGPFVIDDQPADESFTVYDHPKAFVFEKTRDLSEEEWLAVLGNQWDGAVHYYIGEPTLLMRLRGAAGGPPLPEADDVEEVTWLEKPLDQWPTVSDWRWNRAVEDNPWQATLVWLLAIQVIGLAAFPLTLRLFDRLPDKGYLFSKSLGLLIISYGTWLLASLNIPANQFSFIVAILAVLALISAIIAIRFRTGIRIWWREHWKVVLIGESVFIFVFGLFVWLRLANPDLWQPWNGGEKMLEIGFLNAIVRSAYMPPYDPFFAGTFINYYYYGLYIVGIMVKLTGIQPVIAFNLAVPMLAALTAINVFGLTANLARSFKTVTGTQIIISGLLGVLFVLFFSNLDGMGQFLRSLAEISDSTFTSAIPGLETLVRAGFGFNQAMQGASVREYDYWAVSRVVPATINEFPYWSFLFADLHPHMIGIPFTVLFLALAYTCLKPSDAPTLDVTPDIADPDSLNSVNEDHLQILSGWKVFNQTIQHELRDFWQWLSWASVWRWGAIPFVLGSVVVINVWELPTYAGLICAAFVVSRYRGHLHPLTVSRTLILLVELGLFIGLVIGVLFLLYRPFFTTYVPLVSGLGFVHDKLPFDQFAKLWGFFLLVIVTWLIWQLSQAKTTFAPLRALRLGLQRWNVLPHLIEIYRRVVRQSDAVRTTLWLTVLITALAVILLALKFSVIAFLLLFVYLAFLLLLRWDMTPEQTFIELLVFTGLLVLLGVQFVFLEDWLGGGDYYRMNTYFKFFIQVWVMFGIASAVMLPRLWLTSERWYFGWRWLWQLVVIILIFSSMVFFVMGTPQRNDNRFPGPRPTQTTLNGTAYMTVGNFEFEYPYGSATYNPIQLNYDYEAIQWLQDNVLGVSIIAEAKIGYYREAGMRVSAYTGLPTILGGLHQGEQHPPQQLGQRDGRVRAFWHELDPTQFMNLARQLNVEYIYFGQIERVIYGEEHLQKFDRLVQQGQLDLVYENPLTRIYQVN